MSKIPAFLQAVIKFWQLLLNFHEICYTVHHVRKCIMQYLPAQNDRKAIYYYYIIILLFYYYYIIILLLLYWTFRIHIAQRLSCARIYKK